MAISSVRGELEMIHGWVVVLLPLSDGFSWIHMGGMLYAGLLPFMWLFYLIQYLICYSLLVYVLV